MDLNLIKRDGTTSLLSDSIQSASLYAIKDFQTQGFYNEYSLSDEIKMKENDMQNITETNGIQMTPDADDILRNGILVETNKGVVCMSLKDVLSSNLNLSVDDFKQVAAQLLSQDQDAVLSESIQQKLKDSDSLLENQQKWKEIEKELPLVQITKESVAYDVEMKLDPPAIPKVLIIPRALNNKTQETSEFFKPIDNHSLFNQNSVNILNYQSEYADNTQSTSTVTSEAVDTSEENEKDKLENAGVVTVKKRGGWPKGRKRKPELLHLPPKAPKTSYNIFLNERRKLYKDKLAFHEITRVVGNQWSNLTTEEKQPYMARAEEDKKRYREELRIYRQSDAYKLYLARKRKKRALDNLMSESDMDGTDDIDDEDNEMLYCDTCDQWFYNLHNKREHLLSRQHKLTEAGDMRMKLATSDSETKGHTSSVSFSTSLDESSMDGTPIETNCSGTFTKRNSSQTHSIHDNMLKLIDSVSKREKEIKVLKARLQESIIQQADYLTELNTLQEKSNLLKSDFSELKQEESVLEHQLFRLWNVPSLFVMNTVEFVNL